MEKVKTQFPFFCETIVITYYIFRKRNLFFIGHKEYCYSIEVKTISINSSYIPATLNISYFKSGVTVVSRRNSR